MGIRSGKIGLNNRTDIKNNNETNEACRDQLEYYSSAFLIFSEKSEDEEFDVFLPRTAENKRIAEALNPFTNDASEVEIEEFDGMHLYIDDGNLFVDLYNDLIGHFPFEERCHRPGFES